MRFNLGTRLFCGFFGVALLGLGSAGYLVDRNVKSSAYEQTTDRLRYEVTMTSQMTASALFAPLARGDVSLQGPVRELGAAVHTQLSIVAPDGALSADSDLEEVDPAASEIDAPEVRQALAGGRGDAIRGAAGAQRLWVAEAITRDGKVLGIARASVPTSAIEAQVTAVRKRLALGAAVALLIAMVSALLIAIGIVRPVRRLADAARRLGKGELDVRAKVAQNDELGDLGRAVDDMAASLESMVGRLDERNADMRRVLDTIDQGLFTVDPSGGISEERSARVNAWFDSPTAGRPLWELFPDLSARARRSFCSGWEQLTDDIIPAELALDQLPKRIDSGALTFELRYIMIGEDVATRRVLVIVTDVTQQVAAERVEAVQRDLLRTIERTQRDREAVVDFLRDADTLVEQAVREDVSMDDAHRFIHTLKGNCGITGIQTIQTFCHDLETRLRAEERGPSVEEREQLQARWSAMCGSIRSLLGDRSTEMAISREQYREVLDAALKGASSEVTAAKLARWTLTSCETSFQRLGDHATTLVARLGKEVDVSVDGGGICLDGERWGGFWAAFVHAVRNSVDHGIEAPEDRVAIGKSTGGRLALRAFLSANDFVVELEDDGRGVAWSKIAERLREQGKPADTTEQLVEGLFASGVSTASAVTELSGRGVGMGALREEVLGLGGTVAITSTLNEGTRLRCTFPAQCATVDPAWVLEREMARVASFRSSPTPTAGGDAESGARLRAA